MACKQRSFESAIRLPSLFLINYNIYTKSLNNIKAANKKKAYLEGYGNEEYVISIENSDEDQLKKTVIKCYRIITRTATNSNSIIL